jgi:DNA polymerase subunit Cdc27.
LGGVLCDGTGCKIQIVPEEDMIRAKAEFRTLTSEHVYSVQKANALPDLGILYAVDKHERDKNDICKR